MLAMNASTFRKFALHELFLVRQPAGRHCCCAGLQQWLADVRNTWECCQLHAHIHNLMIHHCGIPPHKVCCDEASAGPFRWLQ